MVCLGAADGTDPLGVGVRQRVVVGTVSRREAFTLPAGGLRLQAEGAELQGVGDRDGVEMVGGNQVAEFREALAQAGFEAGQLGNGAFGSFTGDDGLNRSVPAPQVGAAQGTNT
mgnify:CR=1 FL=1